MIILDVRKTPGMFGDRSRPWFSLFTLNVERRKIHDYLDAEPVVANEPGLGNADYWAIQFDCGLKVLFEAFHDSPQVMVAADLPCPQHVERHLQHWRKALVDVSDQFLDDHASMIRRFSSEMPELEELRSYQVWRQGDDGNQVRCGLSTTKRDAECWLAEFESHHHKQIYWVSRSE